MKEKPPRGEAMQKNDHLSINITFFSNLLFHTTMKINSDQGPPTPTPFSVSSYCICRMNSSSRMTHLFEDFFLFPFIVERTLHQGYPPPPPQRPFCLDLRCLMLTFSLFRFYPEHCQPPVSHYARCCACLQSVYNPPPQLAALQQPGNGTNLPVVQAMGKTARHGPSQMEESSSCTHTHTHIHR